MYFTIPRLIFTLLFIYFLYCTWVLVDDRLPFPKKFFHDILGWHEPYKETIHHHDRNIDLAICKRCDKVLERNRNDVVWKESNKTPAVDIRENPRARFEIKTKRRKM